MPTLYWTTPQPQLPQTKSATLRRDWQQAKTSTVIQKLVGNLQNCCGVRNPAMLNHLQVTNFSDLGHLILDLELLKIILGEFLSYF